MLLVLINRIRRGWGSLNLRSHQRFTIKGPALKVQKKVCLTAGLSTGRLSEGTQFQLLSPEPTPTIRQISHQGKELFLSQPSISPGT